MRNDEENLIGYLLDALDENEHRAVEAHLASSPDDRRRFEQLRRALEPLALDLELNDPPAGLAADTLAAFAARYGETIPRAPVLSSNEGGNGGFGWWRRADVLVAALLLIVVTSLGAILVMRSRNQAEVMACQNNLRVRHQQFVTFADNNQEKLLPKIAADGPLSFAGAYVLILRDAGFDLPNDTLICPGTDEKATRAVTSAELHRWFHENPSRYRHAVQSLGGCYAYSLGYLEGDRLQGIRMQSVSDLTPILGDAPPFSLRAGEDASNSRNHGGRGQNVLYVGGNVQFCTIRTIGGSGDDVYLNHHRKARAGVDRFDSVLGASWASPGPR